MKRILTGLFLVVLHALTAVENDRIHVFVSTLKNWDDARTYCNTYYTDLSTITSEEEYQSLIEEGGTFSQAWIGLNKKVNPNDWMWADGQPLDYSRFYSDESSVYKCTFATPYYWYKGYCQLLHPFYCYYNFRLTYVMLNMTWEDALNYCRYYYIDLVSATKTIQLDLLEGTLENVTVTSVWTGLRFLAGKWHWLSKNFKQIPYQGPLLSCPEEPYRCGAYNKTTAQWEMRDCEEKLSFVCYY